MKRLILLLLFLPVVLSAQSPWWSYDTLVPRGTHIDLPDTKRDNAYSSRGFIITRDADYKSLFEDSVQSRLPEIDFTRYELVADVYCIQCFTTCHGRPQCHRNACRYSRSWVLMEKQHRIMLSADSLVGPVCFAFPGFVTELVCYDDSCFSDLQAGCKLKSDTVDFNRSIVVARELHIDCNTPVEHEFYLDTVRRCVVWRLYTGESTCHGMDKRSFVFSLPKPPAGYAVRFERYSF